MTTYENIAAWYKGLHEYIQGTPKFEPLLQLFPVTLDDLRDAQTGQAAHMRAIKGIADSLSSSNQAFMIEAIDGYLRHKLFMPSVGGSGDTQEACRAMAERGHVSLPSVEAATIAEMKTHFEGKPIIPGMHMKGTAPSTVEEARKSQNVARFETKTVLTCPHLVEIASDPEVIALAEGHLGAMPTIIGYSAWWSFAEPEEAREAQLFHGDLEDYRFCKMFIYLTDVDMQSGPHVYIEGTYEPDDIAAMRERWPDEQQEFFEWYFRNFWKDEDQTLRYCGKEPVILTGPAGSRFLVNTRGMHKGLLPEKSDRLICQVLYGVSPRMLEELNPVTLGTPETAVIPAWIGKRPFNYVNRLFIE